MKRKSGFTLVELLVVIGIIALLISILLPALGRVRWQAQLTKCSAQMRDLTFAVQMYCNDNRGFFPPSYQDYSVLGKNNTNNFGMYYSGGGASGTGISWLWTFQWLSASTLANPKDPGAGLGRLYKTGYMRSAKVLTTTGSPFACPSAKNPEDSSKNYISSYYFNPHLALRTSAATPGGFYAVPWWPRITNYGRYTGGNMNVMAYSGNTTMAIPSFRHALITDPIYDMLNNTHARGNIRAWNFAYADGSVRTFVTDSFASRATGHWGQFLDMSDALQHAADGGAVDFRGTAWLNSVYSAMPIDPQ